MSKPEKFLLLVNIVLYGFLSVFSYAYVDLNLTLSQNPKVLNFVNLMQQLGYFHRPQATAIYFIFLIIAFSFFIINLWLFYKSKIGLTYLKLSTLVNTAILILSYPFLSADLFNYMFDAKIILHYNASPYTHRALDFPNDDWIRFMRWVHRYSPYGPLWLGFSLLPSVLGFGKFILTLFSFKIFIAGFHLINSYLIYKISRKMNNNLAVFSTAFYALNPLFLIEGVANSHNDIVLLAFMLASILFIAQKNRPQSYFAIIAGALIKYIPILNLPALILEKVLRLDVKKIIILNLLIMSFFTIIYSSIKINVPFVSTSGLQTQFQPWYLFWTIPLISLLPKASLLVITIIISFGASLRYLPYLYFGDWSQPYTTTFMSLVTIAPPLIAGLIILSVKFFHKK